MTSYSSVDHYYSFTMLHQTQFEAGGVEPSLGCITWLPCVTWWSLIGSLSEGRNEMMTVL